MSFNCSGSTKEKSSIKIVHREVQSNFFPWRTANSCLGSVISFMELTKLMEKMCPKVKDLEVWDLMAEIRAIRARSQGLGKA